MSVWHATIKIGWCHLEYIEQEMRHRKKKHKTVKKASHKHLNEPCVIGYPANWFLKGQASEKMHPIMSAYCPICGKVGQADLERWFVHRGGVSDGYPGYRWSDPSEEAKLELDPDTRTLPTFRVKDPFVKFVEIEV